MKAGEEIRTLPNCAHAFHSGGCIDRWLRAHNSCPVCKRAVLPCVSISSAKRHGGRSGGGDGAAASAAEEEEGRAGAAGVAGAGDSYRDIANVWAELARYAHARSEV